MAVTLAEIAEQCGVSKVTVSRILANRGAHSPRTRRRVLETARRLGYMPNASARAITTGRFGSIAIVISDKSEVSHLTGMMISGAEAALAEVDMHLTIAQLGDEVLSSEQQVPKILRQWMVDGVILNYTHRIPSSLTELIQRHRVPAVWMNSRWPSDCVYQDNALAAVRATRNLIALGHRRIAYADFFWGTAELDGVHGSVLERQGGYEQAMRESGLEARVIRPLRRASALDSVALAREALARPDRPTAVLCYWVHVATPVLLAAKSLGLVVPHDLSIVTFASEGLIANCGIDFTALLDPEYEMGYQAVRQLHRKIESPGESLPALALALRDCAGMTCGPAH